MENNNCCQNCKYFIKHYVIVNNKYLRPTKCGHCTHSRISARIPHKKLIDGAPCNYFEPAEATNEETQNGIFEVLKKIQKNLKEITLILGKD